MSGSSDFPVTFPVRLASPSGLSVELHANGSIRRIDHGDIMINLFLGNEAEGGPAKLWLRPAGGVAVQLLGPSSPARYRFFDRGMSACGRCGDLRFRLSLVLAESAPVWFWHIEVENTGSKPSTCDLVLVQDIGLAHYGAIRLNEYYVSHYIDHTALAHPRQGLVVASRQNQSMGGRCPWCLTGSLAKGVSFATDALQLHGLATRSGESPPFLTEQLPGKRLQQEHSMVGIQDEVFTLQPGEACHRGFFCAFEPDKAEATSDADKARVEEILAMPEATVPEWPADATGTKPAVSLFATAPCLETIEATESECALWFGGDWRHVERMDGRLLSFFTSGGDHVVTKEKERKVLRPHGHLLRSGASLTPDESALTSTAWMNGVFHSMITQGHVSINRLLSTCHSYLGLFRSHGQRVFVEIDGAWHLLGLPSAFAMALDSCRWLYRHRGGLIEVVATAPAERHELRLDLRVLEGPAVRFLVSHHVALHGDDGSGSIPVRFEKDGEGVLLRAVPDSDVGRRFPNGAFRIAPTEGTAWESHGGDEFLFEGGQSLRQPYFCVVTAPAKAAGLVIEGKLLQDRVAQVEGFWSAVGGLTVEPPPAEALAAAAGRAATIFPWFVHNALVHYLSPRGLEQYSGGGWGTRDVCQGPVELLLALGRFEPIRDLLCRVFRQQNPDGDWPQWFMFFERERNIRPGDSHGDIVYWPILALAQYLTATGDASLLDERLPFFHFGGEHEAEHASIRQHVERALSLIRRRVIEGTRLAAYGHGDWNDSLQPARPDMRERLCSSWTVTLNFQTIKAFASACRAIGDEMTAAELENEADAILADFQQILVVDGVVTGLAYFHEHGQTDHLLHPKDRITGLSYSLLPMIHAVINDMFTPEQAEAHLGIVRTHLSGPDGAHLFDRPLAYHGGPQKYFQRAESASYFGREIGIMYTHAHLRYCEALARFGDSGGFFRALCQANPVALQEIVPCAALRQSNCYYSSSDPAFADRHEASRDYAKVARGEITLEGGWRVYSSGAGIAARLIVQCLLGLRIERDALVIDPVMPPALDGLKARLNLAGQSLDVIYQIGPRGCGPLAVEAGGTCLAFHRDPNPYRPGAVRVSLAEVSRSLRETNSALLVRIG